MPQNIFYNLKIFYSFPLYLIFSVVEVFKLITDGDVECNPRPTFGILKVILGSSHQGYPKFVDSYNVPLIHNFHCVGLL